MGAGLREALLVAAIAAVAAFYVISAESDRSAAYSCKDCNVVLISMDTVRPDFLGAYGYSNSTPNLDSFADGSVLFSNAYTQGAWTLPSHLSLFTSKYPAELFSGSNLSTTSSYPLLAELLRENGYRTAAFTDYDVVGSANGFDKGFDFFSENSPSDFQVVVPKAVEWVENNKDSKFFVFIHGYDAHAPYGRYGFAPNLNSGYSGILKNVTLNASVSNPYMFNNSYCTSHDMTGMYFYDDKGFFDACSARNGTAFKLGKADADYIQDTYFDGVLHADFWTGKVFEELDRLNLTNRTIVIVFSDHGEDLMDHGYFGHYMVYEDITRVVLMMRLPNAAPRAVQSRVRLIDVVPTLFDALKIGNLKAFDGRSLLPAVEGRRLDDVPVISEFNWYMNNHVVAVIDGDMKLIYDPYSDYVELYNITADKGEKTALSLNTPVVGRLLDEIRKEIPMVQSTTRDAQEGFRGASYA